MPLRFFGPRDYWVSSWLAFATAASRAAFDVTLPEIASEICWLMKSLVAPLITAGCSDLALASEANASTLASDSGVPSDFEKYGSFAEALVDGKMFTIFANAAWFSALVTNRASAIAAAWFLVFADTESPCTYSGGVSSAGDGTTLPFSDGLSFMKSWIALPPPVVHATLPWVKSLELPKYSWVRMSRGR